nr:diguanylate cyclase [Coleofasciculus sp. FACHB-T130]
MYETLQKQKVQSRRQQLGTISISLGVACFPIHGNTEEAVIHAVDAALYKAKVQGRDRVLAYATRCNSSPARSLVTCINHWMDESRLKTRCNII